MKLSRMFCAAFVLLSGARAAQRLFVSGSISIGI